MSSVGGKAGDNWRDAVDRDGNRYFLFELNRDRFPNDPTNPYQVWALSLSEGDRRGLLRVVFHPAATMTRVAALVNRNRKTRRGNDGLPWNPGRARNAGFACPQLCCRRTCDANPGKSLTGNGCENIHRDTFHGDRL